MSLIVVAVFTLEQSTFKGLFKLATQTSQQYTRQESQ